MDMKIGNRLLEGSCVIHMLRCCHETVNGTRFVVCVCVGVRVWIIATFLSPFGCCCCCISLHIFLRVSVAKLL
jgi:hypothetical protein